MSLIKLNPSKGLTFDFDNLSNTEETLHITNVTDSAIAFKVKTTAPKAYLVKPSSDLLRKGQSCAVQIVLQPTQIQPGQDPTSHRFLVQACAVSGSPTQNLTKEEWSQVAKRDISEHKLEVYNAKGPSTATDSASRVSLTGLSADEMQKKYDELSQYLLELEKQIVTLQNDNRQLKNSSGYALWHILIAVLIAVALGVVVGSKKIM